MEVDYELVTEVTNVPSSCLIINSYQRHVEDREHCLILHLTRSA